MRQKSEIKKILWVDDEIDQLRSQIIFLEGKGYHVTPVSNGDDAVKLVGKEAFDLILLDEMMPGKDGLTTLEEIKEINPYIPVIMVTKSEEEDLMEQAIGKKIDDYLTKPVNPSQILSAVKRILEVKWIREDHLSQDYLKDFRKISDLLNTPLGWQDWIEIHKTLSEWDLEVENIKDLGLKQTHSDQRKECNLQFGKYIDKEYQGWLSSEDSPTVSPDVAKKYLFPILRQGKSLFFIVVDCMRLDQWMIIEPLLDEYFNIKTDYYFSILPTATPYSRNAIFSGLFPDALALKYPELWKRGSEDELSRNRYESDLMKEQLKSLGVRLKTEPKYKKIVDKEEGGNLSKRISTFTDISFFSIVFNFLDMLAHGRSESEILMEITPDEAAFRSLMRSWFTHSSLFEILKYLSTQNCEVVITTDHGSVLGTRGTIAYGRKDTSPNLRYKYGDNLKCDTKEALLIKNPKDYKLPVYSMGTTYIIAKEDFYFVYPTKLSEYRREYRNTFQHGGISLEEMILPVATLKPKR
ncbi:MAG: response regulator [Candidatus Zixiibacteriota bacterium]